MIKKILLSMLALMISFAVYAIDVSTKSGLEGSLIFKTDTIAGVDSKEDILSLKVIFFDGELKFTQKSTGFFIGAKVFQDYAQTTQKDVFNPIILLREDKIIRTQQLGLELFPKYIFIGDDQKSLYLQGRFLSGGFNTTEGYISDEVGFPNDVKYGLEIGGGFNFSSSFGIGAHARYETKPLYTANNSFFDFHCVELLVEPFFKPTDIVKLALEAVYIFEIPAKKETNNIFLIKPKAIVDISPQFNFDVSVKFDIKFYENKNTVNLKMDGLAIVPEINANYKITDTLTIYGGAVVVINNYKYTNTDRNGKENIFILKAGIGYNF